MVTQETIGRPRPQDAFPCSPNAVVIYFAYKTYRLQKALPINHSQSQPILSRHATKRSSV